jgi:hypothetical protein
VARRGRQRHARALRGARWPGACPLTCLHAVL